MTLAMVLFIQGGSRGEISISMRTYMSQGFVIIYRRKWYWFASMSRRYQLVGLLAKPKRIKQ
jgi:hypothetical protein